MHATVIEKINAMNDFQVIRCYNALSRSLISKSDASMDTLLANVPAQLEAGTEIKSWEYLSEQEVSLEIPQQEAARMARQALLLMAANPVTAESVGHFLQTYRENEMAAGTIMVLGGFISLIMLIATFKFEIKDGKMELSIGGNRNPEELKALGQLIKDIMGSIPDSILGLLKGQAAR